MPDWFVLLLFIAVPAVAAAAAHSVVRRLVPAERLIPHHDVAGFLVAVVGVLYAVVLGFVVVTVWSSFDSVQRTADEEAGFVGDAYGYAQFLPEPARTLTSRALAAYAIEVRDREWQTLARGEPDMQARADLLEAVRAVQAGERRTDGANASFEAALSRQSAYDGVSQELRNVFDRRRLRLIEANNGLPPAMYLGLIFGAFMVLAFAFLFGVENRYLQYAMTAILAGCIGLLIGIIVEFNSPYRGVLRVQPAAWDYVIDVNHFRGVR